LWGRSGKFTADVSAGEEENMEKEEPDFRHHQIADVAFIHSPGLRIRIAFMRIRIALMRIRIQLFTLTRS
jgi:hypothetical protein